MSADDRRIGRLLNLGCPLRVDLTIDSVPFAMGDGEVWYTAVLKGDERVSANGRTVEVDGKIVDAKWRAIGHLLVKVGEAMLRGNLP